MGVMANPGSVEGLAQALGQFFGNKDLPSGNPVGPYYSGPNGLWSTPGVAQELISTVIQPRGLAGALPARGSNLMYPQFQYLTGFGDDTGSEPETPCDDAPTGGAQYGCITFLTFGRYTRQTREFDITRAGQINTRAEPLDLRLMNANLLANGQNNNGIVIPDSASDAGFNYRNELKMRMQELGRSFQNLLMKQLWYGNPANSNAGGGYTEFRGLDNLISTGHVDALTNVACTSLDSDIKDFNYRRVNDLTSNGTDIVNTLIALYRYIKSIATRTNLDPATWAFVMREQLYYEVTKVWPCAYMTSNCFFGANADTVRLNISADEQIRMRDDMRNNKYLLLDGERVPVIFDDAIIEESSSDNHNIVNGYFSSDIYLVPLTVRGGLSVTYWEYFNWSGPNAAMQVVNEGRLGNYFWTDGGKYLWHAKPPNNWCIQYISVIEPRLILLTPHLAGRLRNVSYPAFQHLRDAFPDDPYNLNGGVTSRSTAPSFYNNTNWDA